MEKYKRKNTTGYFDGEKFQCALKLYGLHQEDLAELLGVSRQCISGYIRNGRCQKETAQKMADFIGIDVKLFFTEWEQRPSRVTRYNPDDYTGFMRNFCIQCIENDLNMFQALQRAGVNVHCLYPWKNGRNPTWKTVEKLANVFGCDPHELIEGKDYAGES